MKDLDRAIFKIVDTIKETNKDDIFTILNHLGADTTKLRVHNAVKRLVKSGHLDYSVGFNSIILADKSPTLKGLYVDPSMAATMRCVPSLEKFGARLGLKYKNIKERAASGLFGIFDTAWHKELYNDTLEAVEKSVKLNNLLIGKIRQLPPIRDRITEINNHIIKYRKIIK